MPRYATTLGIRGKSQSNDRQVLPTPILAHIKANASATVAGDRCVRRCAWPHEYFDPTVSKHDAAIAEIIEAIRQLMAPPSPKEQRSIGFAPWQNG